MSGSATQIVSWDWTWATSPTSCYIDSTGIHAPPFDNILAYLQAQVRAIFGSDLDLDADTQDGQFLGIFATAIYDTNSLAIQVYNSYSPVTAIGVGLSSNVKVNGITRLMPTNSTVTVTITGVVGTAIFNAQVRDLNQNIWNLPAQIIIPPAGEIDVTATAVVSGYITAAPNTITTILTPTFGWQSVNNAQSSVPGAPLETDAQLRIRQTRATMAPSVTALEGLVAAVVAVPHVSRYAVYENDTPETNDQGVPPHSIALVIEGGDSQQIAKAIAVHKTPGAYTYGTTPETIVDVYGVPHQINYFTPTSVPISVRVSVVGMQGYTSFIGSAIAQSIINYISNIPIGQPLFLNKIITAANLFGSADSLTYNIFSIQMWRGQALPSTQDIVLAFNEMAVTDATLVTVAPN